MNSKIDSTDIQLISDLLDLSGGQVDFPRQTGDTTTHRSINSSFSEITKYISTIKEDDAVSLTNTIVTAKSPSAKRIIRTHFVEQIIKKLEWVAENHTPGKYNSAVHLSHILDRLIKLFKKNKDDPFSSYALALYDGLSNNDNWVTIERNVYSNILHQIKNLNNRDFADYSVIDKEIIKLDSWV